MMRCKQVQNQLAEYVDDLLGAGERDAVSAHVAQCEACRAAARDIAAATPALSALVTVRPPASFAPRVRSVIRAQAPRALAPSLLSPDLRAAFSGAFLMLLGVLGTRYLIQPPSYVAPTRTVAVAMATVAPIELPSIEARPASLRPPKAQPAAGPQRSTGRTAWRHSGLTQSLSAITGPPPSRDRLAPKRVDTNRKPGDTSAMVARGSGRTETPAGPLTGRASLHLAAMTDRGAAPRLAEETTEDALRLVALPAADRPTASGARGDGPEAGPTLRASNPADADAPFGFDDMFNESSLPRYADVS